MNATDNATAVIWADDEWSEKAIPALRNDRFAYYRGDKRTGHQAVVASQQLGQTRNFDAGEASGQIATIGGYQAANALISAGIHDG
jgi:UDP-N-acetylmuramoyl-L-alanyl-D-glutamate--2,6-diaminopimelate ligase